VDIRLLGKMRCGFQTKPASRRAPGFIEFSSGYPAATSTEPELSKGKNEGMRMPCVSPGDAAVFGDRGALKQTSNLS
jgi:hypothetical protein